MDLRKYATRHPEGKRLLDARALESAHRQLNSLKTVARSLQSEFTGLKAELDRAEREAWSQKVKRADTTAKLKSREHLLDQIQRSALWKIVKPLWKPFHRSAKPDDVAPQVARDLAFALDLPQQWKTSREILLIKGWCFSRHGREIAGVRAKIGRKAHLARYGLERPDVADSFSDWPAARQSGFTIELRVPPGRSTVRLEMIEQGLGWRPFFEHELERDGKVDGESVDELPAETAEPAEGILKLPSLSAVNAFELLQPAFRKDSQRTVTGDTFFSILTPSFNSKPRWLAEAAFSLLNQSFADWEWCIVDDGSDDRESKKLLELLSSVSPRVRVTFAENAGISAATNKALELARGQYVCFLDHDDLLHPLALEAVREKLCEGYDVVYSDEDKLDDASGDLVEPFFKPDWSPEYFRGAMYVGHLLCVRRDLARATRFDSTFDGVQDYEFLLRLSESEARIAHLPRVLYHWRKTPGSIAERVDAKPQIGELQARAVNAQLARVGLPARADQSKLPHRLNFTPADRETPSKVSIVIPTRDAPDVFGRCLKSIFEKTSYPDFEVIVMDNETTDARSLALMNEFPIRRLPFPGPFNFSQANNQGAAAAAGGLLVFLNNDTEVVAPDWLQHLAYYAEQKDVGAAGALLAYPDRTVQHAGVALGMRGTADHLMRRFPLGVDGYAGSLVCAREVSAVTGACLMIRKPLFDEIGGFNEHFFTAYQDVDLCLRLRTRGLRVIYTPQAFLLHHESISRQSYYDMIDRMLLLDRWEEVIERGDPYYNPNLNLERGDYSRCSA